MCFLVQNRKINKVFELAKDAQFICKMCGRTASSGENICSPVKMTED